MKKSLITLASICVMGPVFATDVQEVGTVIATRPIIRQVQIPQQVCSQTPMTVSEPKSGAGAVMGAIAGGAVGSTVGQGSGNAAATMLGIMGGAIMGDKLEGSNATIHSVPSCSIQLVLQNTSVFEVEYEYAQKRYIVELPYDPGQTIPIRISPAVPPMASAPPMPAPAGISTAPPVMTTQPTVIAPAPAPVYIAPYPSYGYPYGYYPPVGINFGFGYYRHYRR